jgi:hypothetical protein
MLVRQEDGRVLRIAEAQIFTDVDGVACRPWRATPRPRISTAHLARHPAWLLLCLALTAAACAKGPPGTLYPSTNFVLYTAANSSTARSLEARARTYLSQFEEYLRLSPPPGSLLRIHHYSWRLNLWRYLNANYPALRWRKSACFETPDSYVIAFSGDPGSQAAQHTLRHELTHYLLAVHYSDVPPWLDEGLAQVMAAGTPYPHLDPGPLDSVRREVNNFGTQGCVHLLTLPPGSLLSPGEYQVACGLAFYLLNRDQEAVSRLHAYLSATGPAIPPERSFVSCWGIPMEEACLGLQLRAGS